MNLSYILILQCEYSMPQWYFLFFSARKPLKHTDNLHNLRHETNDPTQRSMYCKDKVYCGAEEYSLEEIRAAKWFSKKKKEGDKRRLEEEQQLIDGKHIL